MKKKPIAVLAAKRSAVGSFGGMYKNVPAHELGVAVAKKAIEQAQIKPEQLGEVIIGHCMMRSDEINIARVISLKASIPDSVPAFSVQRQCASGLQAVVSGMQQIWCGENELVLAGGVENMSRVPYVLKDHRWGGRLWNGEITDMLTEGLTDPIGHFHMGITAENLAAEFDISRGEQDELAASSHQKALAAIDSGRFDDEIVAIEIPTKKGRAPQLAQVDEHPRRDVTLASLSKLKPAFKENGSVTAGNASGLNDGAAMVVLASHDYAQRTGQTPLAWLLDHQAAGVEPQRMGFGPVPAVKKLLERRGISLSEIGLVELNEAFAAQYLACEKALGLNREITNVLGSGIALGHPVGATGCRILTTLIYEMNRRNVKRGLATLCVGGGMGKAILVDNPGFND